jgi:hypothetical protein
MAELAGQLRRPPLAPAVSAGATLESRLAMAVCADTPAMQQSRIGPSLRDGGLAKLMEGKMRLGDSSQGRKDGQPSMRFRSQIGGKVR